jgi:hypothetical protein
MPHRQNSGLTEPTVVPLFSRKSRAKPKRLALVF